jgi:hypothetical protein
MAEGVGLYQLVYLGRELRKARECRCDRSTRGKLRVIEKFLYESPLPLGPGGRGRCEFVPFCVVTDGSFCFLITHIVGRERCK